MAAEDVEQFRRSVAMLTPGAMALRREDALGLLAEVIRARQAAADLAAQVRELEGRIARLKVAAEEARDAGWSPSGSKPLRKR